MRVSDNQVLATRSDGSVMLYSLNVVDGEKYKLIRDWAAGTATVPLEAKSEEKPDAVVELTILESNIAISCSRKGKIVRYDTEAGTSKTLTIKGPLDAFTIHPVKRNLVAVGGQERDTEIVELDWKELTQKSIWQARNVKETRIHLRVPVWVKKIYFLDTEEEGEVFKLLVVTRYGQFRLYNPKEGRRPRQDMKISEHPITVVERGTGTNSHTIVASDTKTSTYVVNITDTSFNMAGKLAGATGAVQALSAYSTFEKRNSPVMATGGLDRYLRVFELDGRSVEAKVFTGTQITAVLVLDGFSKTVETSVPVFIDYKKRERDAEADADDLWDQLDEVSAKQNSKKKKSSK